MGLQSQNEQMNTHNMMTNHNPNITENHRNLAKPATQNISSSSLLPNLDPKPIAHHNSTNYLPFPEANRQPNPVSENRPIPYNHGNLSNNPQSVLRNSLQTASNRPEIGVLDRKTQNPYGGITPQNLPKNLEHPFPISDPVHISRSEIRNSDQISLGQTHNQLTRENNLAQADLKSFLVGGSQIPSLALIAGDFGVTPEFQKLFSMFCKFN